MSSTSFSFPLLSRATLGAAQLAGIVVLALALSAPVSTSAQTPAVPDAPTVAPAPLVDKPLQPAVAQEVADDQPSPEHVWVPGHWRWQEGAYVWASAHWELPPMANAAWVEPRWEKKSNGYALVEGYWQEVAAPPPAAQEAAVVANIPPPPPNREVIVERPSPAHVWISGYWGWRSGRHVWMPGHWELPPRERAAWVAPRWEQRGGSYVLVQGFWRDVGVAVSIGAPPPHPVEVARPSREMIVIHDAPPPPRHETLMPRPSPRHVLIEGYWAWLGGRQVWISSHWELPPRGHSAWVAPRWEHRREGYVFVEGYWR